MNQFPPSPRVIHKDRFKFFRKFAEKFASQGEPPVSKTPAVKFSTTFPTVVDTGGKFATGVNDTGDNTMVTIFKLLTTKHELEENFFNIFSL